MGCAVGGLLLYALGQYQADYINAQRSSAYQRRESSGTPCYRVPIFGPICIGDDKAVQAEAERADNDLLAQQNMAEWAKWLTLLTAAQLVVGAFGLAGLWLTLRAARKGNKISRGIGEAQTRAYMSVAAGKAEILQSEASGGYSVKLIMTFANSGASPAIRFRWGARIAFAYLGAAGDALGLGLVTPEAEGYDIPANTPKFGMWLTHSDFSLRAADVTAWRLGGLRIYVDVYTVFRDVFGKEISHVEYFRGDLPARISKRHYTKLEYGKGISSIPFYLAELQVDDFAAVESPKGLSPLSGRIERRSYEEDDNDD